MANREELEAMRQEAYDHDDLDEEEEEEEEEERDEEEEEEEEEEETLSRCSTKSSEEMRS